MLEQLDKDFAFMLYQHWQEQASANWRRYEKTRLHAYNVAYWQAYKQAKFYYFLSA